MSEGVVLDMHQLHTTKDSITDLLPPSSSLLPSTHSLSLTFPQVHRHVAIRTELVDERGSGLRYVTVHSQNVGMPQILHRQKLSLENKQEKVKQVTC